MEAEIASAAAQLGAAGLIGWMWLSERRSAVEREKQLGEAHDAVMRERTKLEALLSALEHNTRAMTAVEIGQRRLAQIVARLGRAEGEKR